LLRVDLTRKAHPANLHELSIAVVEDGIAAGIVQWMQVDLAEGIAFENHPDDYTDGGWLQVLHTFPEPISVRAGDRLNIAVGHDRVTLILRPMDVVAATAQVYAA
jgi:type II protein arginine methyltransferase